MRSGRLHRAADAMAEAEAPTFSAAHERLSLPIRSLQFRRRPQRQVKGEPTAASRCGIGQHLRHAPLVLQERRVFCLCHHIIRKARERRLLEVKHCIQPLLHSVRLS